VNRETVQAELKSSGALDTARLFSQLVINGDGKATILDPISGKNIRDLDGFSAPDVENGMAKYVVDVHGRTTRRTVSDFTGKLPLAVSVEYFLDGKKKAAKDLVGKSGILDVKYTVENVSATPTEISYTVAGKKTTKTIDLVTPFVGQLSINLPSSFTDIDTPRADVAGDGRGGQLLNWTMVLFEPIGQVKQQFGYTARVKDLQLPAAKIQAVPVSPNRHPELAFGEKGFSDGAASGGNVAFAGTTIDTNLAKLRDGAGALLDGLTQLAAGAAALKDGLAGSAAPGAKKLADGLGQANDGGAKLSVGLNKLSDGAGQLRDGLGTAKAGSSKLAAGADALGDGLGQVKDGSGKLAAGLGAASAGSEKLLDGSQDLATGAGLTAAGAKSLSTGLAQISAGLDQLAATTGLPAVKAGLQQLRLGIDHPVGAAGPTDPGGLLQGLQQIAGGLGQLSAPTGLPAAKGGVDQVKAGLDGALQIADPTKGIVGLKNGVALASGNVGAATTGLACPTPPVTAVCIALATATGALSQVALGLDHPAVPGVDPGGLKQQTEAAAGGLGQVSSGLATAIGGVSQLNSGVGAAIVGVQTSLLGGIDQLIAGVTTAVNGVLALQTGAKTASAGAVALADGTAKVAAGAGQLSETGAAPLADGLSQLLTGSLALDAGLGKLADGGGQAVDGVHAIDDGLTKLSAGSVALAAGAEEAAAGSGDLSDGLQQLYAGGQQLADGLGAAADGSGQLADGLEKAKGGNVQIKDGAEALRTQAAVPLAAAGQSTATEYAEHFAIMTALDEKAADGALPYGAPAGATGTAAYDFVLAGATSTSQDNTTRGIAAIALLALASASGMFVRRRVLSQ
jgi:putative membrane protein